MGRIFSIIAAISALTVILAGSGSYWFSTVKLMDTEQKAAAIAAQGLAAAIEVQLSTLQQSIDAIAGSPDVIAALNLGDAVMMSSLENKLQLIIPGALKVRLLTPATNQPDLTATPNMGFGDLEMIRATYNAKQKPVIQGEGAHRHLAFTSAITLNNKILGVILVSIKDDLTKQAIAKAGYTGGYIEITQDKLQVATAGDAGAKIAEPHVIPLGSSRWNMNVWTKQEPDIEDVTLTLCIIIIPTLLSCLIYFIGYRKLLSALMQDQTCILTAAKDLMSGKISGNYPVSLPEMQPIIATLMQFKRVIHQDQFAAGNSQDAQEPHLFEESFNLDFLEETPTDIKDAFPKKTVAVTMPNLDQASKPSDNSVNFE